MAEIPWAALALAAMAVLLASPAQAAQAPQSLPTLRNPCQTISVTDPQVEAIIIECRKRFDSVYPPQAPPDMLPEYAIKVACAVVQSQVPGDCLPPPPTLPPQAWWAAAYAGEVDAWTGATLWALHQFILDPSGAPPLPSAPPIPSDPPL
jgi:opacity protein-like surface antigen